MPDTPAERPGGLTVRDRISKHDLDQAKLARRSRRRPGLQFALGLSVVGILLVAHTFWGELRDGKPKSRNAAASQGLAQIWNNGDSGSPLEKVEAFLGSESKDWNSLHAIGQERTDDDPGGRDRPGEAGTIRPPQPSHAVSLHGNGSSFPLWPTPVIDSIVTGDQVLRDLGGNDVTVRGAHFGSVDADVRVKIGDTWSPRTEWVSQEMLVSKTPRGVGVNLPVAVWVSEPAYQPSMGIADDMFSYSRPFIYDIVPLLAGQPLEGPFNVTLKAWGIGYWDTHPVAQLNGQACRRSIWVDNSSVVCEIPMHARVAPQNPEIKVAGQRSMCGILAPGVCTISVNHGSVASPSRIRQEVQEIKARGGDWRAALRQMQQHKTIGGWGQENTPDKPCTDIGNCRPKTFFLALSGSVLMMMGMGSLCICILAARPIVMWLSDDWKRARGEALVGEYDELLEAEEEAHARGEVLEAGPEESLSAGEEEAFTFDVRVF